MPAGYSGTPLVGKLGIKPGQQLALLGAPSGWEIPGLPADVGVSRRRPAGAKRFDVVIAFFTELAALKEDVKRLAGIITADGSLWMAWPRRAGGHTSDITDNEIRGAVLPLGLVDVKVAAIDENWSGLKMVWRKELRAGLR